MTPEGYIIVKNPDHPRALAYGYVFEHILKVEEATGKPVDRSTHIHHRDGNKSNNAIENLELLTPGEHQRIHSGWKRIDGKWWKTCTGCNRFLSLDDDFYKRGPGCKNAYQSFCKRCQCRNVRVPVPGRKPGRPRRGICNMNEDSILAPAPLSDREIEELWHQEPINDFRHLPMEEPTQVTEEI